MNILYLHTHDTGRVIQPYGYNIPTPNLMAMAQKGVIFRNCFTCAPTCSPSRAAMLTGMNPHSCGMLGLAHRGFSLTDPSKHLANHLKKHGYETVLCGIQHVTQNSQVMELGYEHVLKGGDREVWDETEDVQKHVEANMIRDLANAKAVADYLKRPKHKPFFLSYGMFTTHRPFPLPAEDINPNYVQPPVPMPDNAMTRKDMAGFMTSARYSDNCIGIVLEALKESGLEEDTFVFFTTDHGIAFPKMKCQLYDSGIGVALIIKFPGNPQQGNTIDALVSHLDLYPTLCDIAEIEQPAWLEGHSIMPLINGDVKKIRDEIFSEVTYHAAYEPMRCIRTKRYKYMKYYDNFDLVVKPNIDDGYSKQFLLEHGLKDMKHDDHEMVFDLYFDPCERVNLINDPNYKKVKQELSSQLDQWMQNTNDPLLQGYVPKPAGARANIKSGLHPNEEEWEE